MTVDSLCEAVNVADQAIRDNHVVDHVVDDRGMVAANIGHLLYS